MTYQGRPAPKRRIGLFAIAAIIVFAICGTCGIVAALGVLNAGDSTTATVSAPASIGQKVKDGKLAFVVDSVDCSATSIGVDPVARKAQGRFCVVGLQVSNIGKSAQLFVSAAQKALDSSGREYSTDDTATLVKNPQTWLGQINPGSTLQGSIVFDVPTDVRLTVLVLHDSPLSYGVRVRIG